MSPQEAFIAEELAEWAPILQQRMQQQLAKEGITITGDLARSMVAKAIGSKEAQLSFLTYGRMNDMGAQRGWRKGMYIGHGKADAQKKPKGTKFYSRTKMGLFGQLASNLGNKYVEALYQQAKAEIDGGKN